MRVSPPKAIRHTFQEALGLVTQASFPGVGADLSQTDL